VPSSVNPVLACGVADISSAMFGGKRSGTLGVCSWSPSIDNDMGWMESDEDCKSCIASGGVQDCKPCIACGGVAGVRASAGGLDHHTGTITHKCQGKRTQRRNVGGHTATGWRRPQQVADHVFKPGTGPSTDSGAGELDGSNVDASAAGASRARVDLGGGVGPSGSAGSNVELTMLGASVCAGTASLPASAAFVVTVGVCFRTRAKTGRRQCRHAQVSGDCSLVTHAGEN